MPDRDRGVPARIRFVASAGGSIGRGHLARALSLAEARWPANPELELELDGGPLSSLDRRRAQAVGLRLVDPGSPVEPGTITVVDVPDPTKVGARFEPLQLAVFDDRETFRGRAAIVVQPSLPAWGGDAVVDRVLAGFDVVPISAAVRARRSAAMAPPSAAGSRRLLVCFGGSDPERVTEQLVPALTALRGVTVDVVIGASYSGPTAGWPLEPIRDPEDFVERLATAELSLLGAGTMKFEAAALGRTMVLLAVADDQLPVGPPFAATGAARYLGDGRSLAPASLIAEITDLLADDDARASLGATAARVVDGAGGDRIAAAVAGLAQSAARS